jgi:hypothetical protein
MFYFNLKYLFCALIIVPVGLASREWSHLLPSFVALYAGDTLWAMLVYFLTRTILTNFKTAFVTALVFSFAIEFLQLYHAPWIENLRNTVPGALVLGSGFLWSDLVCYSVGIAGGAFADQRMLKDT